MAQWKWAQHEKDLKLEETVSSKCDNFEPLTI